MITEKQPAITSDDLKTISDVLGTCTTDFSSSGAARSTNLAVGAGKINGRVLMPGEVISGYECLQPFTLENGYKTAAAYENGQVVDSIGGGVCQIATTLYDAALQGTAWKERPSFYFELSPEGYEHGLGMWCSPSAFLAAYRRKIESNPAAFERMAKKIEKDPLFHLEGRAYKKFKNETLSPLLQAWYPKKDVLLVARGVCSEHSFPFLNYHSSSQRNGAGSKISMLFWMPLKRNKKGVDLG